MEFRKMSLAELREYAKEKGIRNISTLKKAELAELLENMEKMMAAKKKEAESCGAQKPGNGKSTSGYTTGEPHKESGRKLSGASEH